ncbi:hypothetical protein D3C87_1746760 [compost metagenome]
MSTKIKFPTSTEMAAAKARKEVLLALSQAEGAFIELRKALGIPARSTSSASHERELQHKRTKACQLIGKMGYRIDHENQKSGLVRIVGPGFSEDFFDIADFDGTAGNSFSNYR